MTTNLRHFLKKNFALTCFILSLACIVFTLGVMVGKFKVFPYTVFQYAQKGIDDWKQNWEQNLEILPNKHLGPARVYHSFKTINKPQAWSGVTFVTTFIKDDNLNGPGLILLDMEGNTLHKWIVPLDSVFPETDRNNWDTLITGARLLQNGDVVFNFNGAGTVKLDVCSNILWTAKHASHHNIFIDEKDNIWTAGRRLTDKRIFNMQYPKKLTITKPETIIQLSPDGEKLKEIDILEVILKSDLKGVLFANGQQRLYHKGITDTFNFNHLNDIEILPEELAEQYPLFNAGDILISFRNLNLIAVLDGLTHNIKWHMVGPFLRQHDPDFIGSGMISVFDNMGGGPADDIGFASRILSIDTNTNATMTTYKASPAEHFFTHERGSHQNLPNGNILITETFAGRIFEVTLAGETVWQYITAWDDKQVIHPYQAERYDDPDGSLARLSCKM